MSHPQNFPPMGFLDIMGVCVCACVCACALLLALEQSETWANFEGDDFA